MDDTIENLNLENEMPTIEEKTTVKPYSPFDELQQTTGSEGNAREATLGIPINIEVVAGRTKISVSDLMNINRGKVLELDSKAGDLVNVTANGKPIALGELTVFDDGRVGITLVEILRG